MPNRTPPLQPARARRSTRPSRASAKPPNARPWDGAELGDVLELMRCLWAVDHGLQSTSKHMEMRHGVTGPQRMVLRLLGRYPRISARELSEIMHLHPSTLTGVLKRLEDRGYIVRQVDQADRRRVILQLTPRGRQLDVRKPGTVEAAVERALTRVGARQLTAAADVLRVLAEELTASV